MIGFMAAWARLTAWSTAPGELDRPRAAGGVDTSSASPLGAPSVCKGNGRAIQLVASRYGTRTAEYITFETSWLGEETCGFERALLKHRRFMRDLVWIGT